MRRAVIAAFSLVSLLAASAGARHFVVHRVAPPGVVNEFRYLGGALVCLSDTVSAASSDALSPCLHIGALRLDETSAAVERVLGKPWKIVPLEDGTAMSLYPLRGDVDASPYLAVRFRAGRVDAIQLSGEETPDSFAFSGLRLGDPERRVRETLGPVNESERLGDTGAILLSWEPYPISIEVRDRKVVSIKIWRGPS